MKITKEFIRDNQDKTLKELFPEVCKVELEVGKWYRYTDRTNFLVYCETFGYMVRGYGFCDGRWTDSRDWVRENIVPATDEEVLEALTNEAVKRGFRKGVSFKSLDNKECALQGIEFLFNKNLLSASTGFEHIIFKEGVWANAITIPTMTIKEAEDKLKCKIV